MKTYDKKINWSNYTIKKATYATLIKENLLPVLFLYLLTIIEHKMRIKFSLINGV